MGITDEARGKVNGHVLGILTGAGVFTVLNITIRQRKRDAEIRMPTRLGGSGSGHEGIDLAYWQRRGQRRRARAAVSTVISNAFLTELVNGVELVMAYPRYCP